jgi:hypothetical protein
VDLVSRLAARRTPLEEAERLAAEFVGTGASGGEQRAGLLFAGLFDTMNRQRIDVINGLERLTRRQREFVKTIQNDMARLRELQDKPDSDQHDIEALTNDVNWETRIFEERRKTIRYACEVPVIIEKRLFALGRAIQQGLD